MNNNPNPQHTKSQNSLILKHLQRKRKITFLKALNMFACLHLPRRIKDIKDGEFDGKKYKIKSKWIKLDNGKRVKEYSL